LAVTQHSMRCRCILCLSADSLGRADWRRSATGSSIVRQSDWRCPGHCCTMLYSRYNFKRPTSAAGVGRALSHAVEWIRGGQCQTFIITNPTPDSHSTRPPAWLTTELSAYYSIVVAYLLRLPDSIIAHHRSRTRPSPRNGNKVWYNFHFLTGSRKCSRLFLSGFEVNQPLISEQDLLQSDREVVVLSNNSKILVRYRDHGMLILSPPSDRSELAVMSSSDCASVRAQRTGQSIGRKMLTLYNSSKIIKATEFKFDRDVPNDNLDMTPWQF